MTEHARQALLNAAMALSSMEAYLRLPSKTLSVSVVMDDNEWHRFMTSFDETAIMRQIIEDPTRQSFKVCGIVFRRAQ